MKNLKLIALVIGCFLFSATAFSQSFSGFGTYTGADSKGNEVVLELNVNGTATLTVAGVSQGVAYFVYEPAYSTFIKFKGVPTANSPADGGSTAPLFRGGLFEEGTAPYQWKLQLNDYGQAPPTQFNSDAIILSFKSF